MCDQEKPVLHIVHLYQRRSEQGSPPQVEGAAGVFRHSTDGFRLALGLVESGQVKHGQLDLPGRLNDLDGLPIDCFKRGSPGFMAPDDFRETLFENSHVEGPGHVKGNALVIERRDARHETFAKPELLLG